MGHSFPKEDTQSLVKSFLAIIQKNHCSSVHIHHSGKSIFISKTSSFVNHARDVHLILRKPLFLRNVFHLQFSKVSLSHALEKSFYLQDVFSLNNEAQVVHTMLDKTIFKTFSLIIQQGVFIQHSDLIL